MAWVHRRNITLTRHFAGGDDLSRIVESGGLLPVHTTKMLRLHIARHRHRTDRRLPRLLLCGIRRMPGNQRTRLGVHLLIVPMVIFPMCTISFKSVNSNGCGPATPVTAPT